MGWHCDSGQSKSLIHGDVLHSRRLLTTSLSIENYKRPIVSIIKLVLFPVFPVQGEHTWPLTSSYKIGIETHSFCGCQEQIVGAWDRHGLCTHYSTSLGHKTQAKQLQRCGWWKGGIALLLAQRSVKRRLDGWVWGEALKGVDDRKKINNQRRKCPHIRRGVAYLNPALRCLLVITAQQCAESTSSFCTSV